MILNQETFNRYGYWPEQLHKTSKNMVLCKCSCCNDIFEKKKITLVYSTEPPLVCTKKSCIRWKIETTCRKKYGETNVRRIKWVNDKIKQTCMDRYGVDSPFQSVKILNKARQTCVARYGVDNPFKSKLVQKSIETQNLRKYGVKNQGGLPDVQEKIKRSNQLHFGVDHAFQAKEVKEHIKQSLLARYGVTTPQKSKIIREKTELTCLKKYGVKTALMLDRSRKTLVENNTLKYGTAYPASLYHKTEDSIKTWLASLGFDFNENNEILKPKQLDLYSEKLKLAIEYCGLYWHNEQSPEPRDANYHYNKYLQCKKTGTRLITIFEDEWKERREQCKNFIMSILGIGEKVGARKCSIRQIDANVCRNFIDSYHIQKSGKQGIAWFGLFHAEKLLGILELGRHPRNNPSLVLTRLCFLPGVSVQGGASKLFKHAVDWARERNYVKIISWSDNRWSTGNVYTKLGFNLEAELPPDYSYVNMTGYKPRLSKQSQKKADTNCPKGTTEKEWCLTRKLARIWDCGKKRWSYKIE